MKNKLNKALTLSSVEFSESFSCVRASCLPPAICVWKNIMGLGGGGGNAAETRRAGGGRVRGGGRGPRPRRHWTLQGVMKMLEMIEIGIII